MSEREDEPLTDAERLELQELKTQVMLPTFTAREREIALTVYRTMSVEPSPPEAMSERAQALEAALRKVLASAFPNDRDHPAMSAAWAQTRAVLAEAPPVDVSPQPYKGTAGIDWDYERSRCRSQPAPLSPVEPTPELPLRGASRLPMEMHAAIATLPEGGLKQMVTEWRDTLMRLEPAPPTPAPCVWRQTASGEWTNGCASASTPEGFYRTVNHLWSHCHFCGHPLEITR